MDLRDESTPETPEDLAGPTWAPRRPPESESPGQLLRSWCVNRLSSLVFWEVAWPAGTPPTPCQCWDLLFRILQAAPGCSSRQPAAGSVLTPARPDLFPGRLTPEVPVSVPRSERQPHCPPRLRSERGLGVWVWFRLDPRAAVSQSLLQHLNSGSRT